MSAVPSVFSGDESEKDSYTLQQPHSRQTSRKSTGEARSRPSAPAKVHYPWQSPQSRPPPAGTSRRHRTTVLSGTTKQDIAGTKDFDPFDEMEQERRKKGKELVARFNPQNPFAPYPGYGYGPFSYYPPPPPRPGEAENGRFHIRESGEASGAASIRQLQELWNKKKVDGIFGSNSGDLTIHLDLDIQEDLGELADELSRLCRLGHFATAKQFFVANLQNHLDRPYVLIQYVDMLLQQGDYKAATQVRDNAIQNLEKEFPNSDELQLLRTNWELMQMFAKSHTLDDVRGAPAIFEDAIEILRNVTSYKDRSLGSTEIQTLALILHLTNHPHLEGKWAKYRDDVMDIFPASSYRRLYADLLSQGRVWDLHDLVTLMPSTKNIEALFKDLFDTTLIPGVQILISDWSNSVHEYDASTALALLSILTYILLELLQTSGKLAEDILKQALPLGLSIMEKDPNNMKSRPYLRLLLAKSRFFELKSRHGIEALLSDLKGSPGVSYHIDSRFLPIYTPANMENPCWKIQDATDESKDPVKLVLRYAKNLGDFTTETLAFQELIRLSTNPVDEFERLCDLQKSAQGDSTGYAQSLASRYLVSNTEESRENLKVEISRLLAKIESTDYWNINHEWLLNMLLYSLEGRPIKAIDQAFERSDTDYRYMDQSLLQEIARKIPSLNNWAQLQIKLAKASKTDGAESHKAPHRGKRTRVRRDATTASKKKTEQTQKPAQEEQGHTMRPTSQRPKDTTDHATAANFRIPQSMQQYAWDPPPPPPSEVVRPKAPENEDIKKKLEEQQQRMEEESEIRKKLEAAFKLELETMQREAKERQEEGIAALERTKREIELVKREAKVAAFEAAQTERKAGEARREALAEAEARARAERHAQELREVERKAELERQKRESEAVARAEAAIRARMEAERKAEKEAEAAMLKKVREVVELRQTLETEAKLKAEIEMLKLQAEERANKEAEVSLKKDEENFKEQALKEAEKERNNTPIHFKDASGRKFSLPYNLCSTWDGMETIIKEAFRNVDDLGPEVEAGHYDLLGPNGEVILPQIWQEVIEPGWAISMQMRPVNQPEPRSPPVRPSQPPPPPGFLRGGLPPPGFPPAPSPPSAPTLPRSESRASRNSGSPSVIRTDGVNDSGSVLSSEEPRPKKGLTGLFSRLKWSMSRKRSVITVSSSQSSVNMYD
ncbi:hypothetical protein F5B20DRAFT_374991 [Whalleya microplaca]|nr:hypothetical protein F5B20DRAFT_374991 [Whalleya microplaca]